MSKVGIDYTKLDAQIYKKAYKLSDVKDKIVKVAFDIVRFKDDDNAAKLWQIQSADDGDYIVALYDTSAEEMVSTASANPWQVEYNKIGKTLNFYYKSYPIVRVASSVLGIKESELHGVESYLPARMNENKKLVSALLKQLDKNVRAQVINKYPELEGV